MLRCSGIVGADHGGHGGEAGAPEEPAPVGVRLAAEEGAVGFGGVLGEEFVEVPGVVCRMLGRLTW